MARAGKDEQKAEGELQPLQKLQPLQNVDGGWSSAVTGGISSSMALGTGSTGVEMGVETVTTV
jgi:hypothetical protein